MKLKLTSALTLSAIATIALLSTTSCKKSNSDSGNSVSATIGTNNLKYSQMQSTYIRTNTYLDVIGLSVNGKDSAGIDVSIPSNAVVGKAVSSDTSFDAYLGYIDESKQVSYSAYNGQGHIVITVTSWDSTNHKIAGTFSGEVYNDNNLNDSLPVANGKFNSSYSVY